MYWTASGRGKGVAPRGQGDRVQTDDPTPPPVPEPTPEPTPPPLAATSTLAATPPLAATPAPRRRWRAPAWTGRVLAGLALAPVVWVAAYGVINPPGGLYMASESWRLGGITRQWRDIGDISPDLARAVMAGEDARFCDHWGFDLDAISAALERNARGGRRVLGASTLSQQVAKNVFLWQGRSWLRKGLEVGFTLLVETLWSKRRILEVYLNVAEMGPGVFGAEAAARRHFGVGADALSLTQAARLAAILPDPKDRNPARPSSYLQRRARVIAAGAETLRADRRDTCVLGAAREN